MGKSKERIKKRVNGQLGPYLVDFETNLLGKIDDRLTERLDELNEREARLLEAVERAEEVSDEAGRHARRTSFRITLRDLGMGLLGGVGFFTVWIVARWLIYTF